ncbi:MAG: SWIM zinc finger family protein [Clostridia bacterium]
MSKQVKDSTDFQWERRARAEEVKATYGFEYVGAQAWVVQHPDDEGRCYLVDMVERRCSCPDWWGFANGQGIDCKHILSVQPAWEELTGKRLPFVFRGKATADCGFVAVIESDDPFQIIPR